MRVAAGILMIITAMFWLFAAAVSSAPLGGWETYDTLIDWFFLVFVLAWAAFIITGGVFCLQRKHWGLCLVSSILCLNPMGILSIIFVCLRKREWERIKHEATP